MLPTFVIIGSAKSGTTSLATNLNKHPEVFVVSRPKEPNYFAYAFDKGHAWYESLFEEAGSKRERGESSPSYTIELKSAAPRRMAALIPDARLIYIVRHPLDRMRSHWMEDMQSGGHAAMPFDRAVREQPHLTATSCYWQHLNRYRAYYPDERIYILFHDDLKRDAAGVFRSCFTYLGVDASVPVAGVDRPVNAKEDLRAATGALKAARRMGHALLGERALQKLPRSWKVMANKLLGRDMEPPRWDDQTRRRVLDAIGPDVAAFLAHCGRPADFWDLSA